MLLKRVKNDSMIPVNVIESIVVVLIVIVKMCYKTMSSIQLYIYNYLLVQ